MQVCVSRTARTGSERVARSLGGHRMLPGVRSRRVRRPRDRVRLAFEQPPQCHLRARRAEFKSERTVSHVKPRPLVFMSGVVALLALLVSLSIATAGTNRSAQARATMPAPKVPNAAAIKAKYGGQTITFVGDSVGGGHQRDT